MVARRDSYAGSLRYHLALIAPNDDRCRIFVDGRPYSWREGEDIVFDETYIHYAENNTDADRVILFRDIERPMRFASARTVNRFFARYLIRVGATRNTDGDRVSAVNKLFGYVYPVRAAFKRLKARDGRLYYAVKYMIDGGLLATILIYA